MMAESLMAVYKTCLGDFIYSLIGTTFPRAISYDLFYCAAHLVAHCRLSGEEKNKKEEEFSERD